MPDVEESMTCPRTATKINDLVQGGQTFEAYSAIRLDDSVIEVIISCSGFHVFLCVPGLQSVLLFPWEA
jgi:hypothetical protein